MDVNLALQFTSTTANDRDQDGCRDIDEDLDDDGDTVLDTVDNCPNGVTYWTPSHLYRYDGDGCYDPTRLR